MARTRHTLVHFSISTLVFAAGGASPIHAADATVPRPTADGGEARELTFNGAVFHRSRGRLADQRTIHFGDSPAVMVSWQEPGAAGLVSHFAVSRTGERIDQVATTENKVRLRYASFDPLAELPRIPAALRAGEGNELFLVQFVGTPLDEMRAEIHAMGGVVERFMTDNTHIIRMGPETRAWVAELPYVRWVGPYHPAYRLDDEILAQAAMGQLENVGARYSISCVRRGMEQQQAIADVVRAMGGHVEIFTPGQYRMEVTVTPAQILEIAHMNEVSFIEPWWGPGGEDMDIIRQLGGAVPLLSNAGFLGQGVRGWIFDSGVITNHQEWGGQAPLVVGANASGSHGTACYGVNFATGVNVQATGMMPLREQGMATVHSHSTQFSGPATRLSLNQLATDPNGPFRAVFQTSSVGSPRVTTYTTITEEVDDYLWQVQLLHCQSQSNCGGECRDSRPQAWAKNIVAVGGMQFNESLDRNQHAWNSGASIGPASDLRIKPELAHSYNGIFTSYSSSTTGYGQFGGTSGATPITCGHFGLLHQMWHEEVWDEFGGASSVFESRPASTTARAMMINTAYRYPVTQGNMTRHRIGWGVAHLGNAYELREKTFIVNETELLTNAQSASFPIHVEPGEAEFKATMVYIDPAGSAAAAQARINDLDLKVTSPSGIVYWGNHGMVPTEVTGPGRLDGENWTVPGGGANTYDTVENVFVQNPEPGVWDVEVIGSQIVQDAVQSTPATDASFALVVTGGTGGPPPAVRITFPGGLPFLIAPNQGHEVTVNIEPGSQNLMPGSPTVHFRAGSSGSFDSMPLTHVSGDQYAATLPGFICGDEPEVYFSAQGDLGETVYLPRNAPDSVFSTTAGVIVTEPILETTFQSAWPAGWSASGLWHVTSACAPAGNTCADGPYAYYGRTATCAYNLPTGTNAGNLNAPEINLPAVPPGGAVMLRFCYALETENVANFDKAELFVNGETRPEWRLEDVAPTAGEPDRYWSEAAIDLTEFAGQSVNLSWRFNTVNSLQNNFRGWHLNNVQVHAEVVGCEACYANCDGSTQEPTLNVDDFTCFINSFAAAQGLPHEQQVSHYSNCDNSSTAPVLNVDDFTCFINAFAAGCP